MKEEEYQQALKDLEKVLIKDDKLSSKEKKLLEKVKMYEFLEEFEEPIWVVFSPTTKYIWTYYGTYNQCKEWINRKGGKMRGFFKIVKATIKIKNENYN